MKQPPLFESHQLSMHAFRVEYFAPLAAIFADEEVMQLALNGHPITGADFARFLADHFIFDINQHLGFVVIIEKKTQDVIGFAGLLSCNYLDKADVEFGFILAKASWGKGYATEIGQATIKWAHQLGYERLLATASPDNKASLRVLEKLGLRPLKTIEVVGRGTRVLLST